MSFFDTRISNCKHSNIPTSKPQLARQTPPAALLMELKHEAQINRRHLGDIGAVHNSLCYATDSSSLSESE